MKFGHGNCNYAGIGDGDSKLCSSQHVAGYLGLQPYEGIPTNVHRETPYRRVFSVLPSADVCNICRFHSEISNLISDGTRELSSMLAETINES